MCYMNSAKLFFSLFLKFPNNGIRALKDLEGPVRENSFLLSMASTLSPPVFDGENYHVWAVKMKAHLRGLGLWQWVESEREEKKLTVAESPMDKKPKAGKKLPVEGSTAPETTTRSPRLLRGRSKLTFGASWRTGENRCL